MDPSLSLPSEEKISCQERVKSGPRTDVKVIIALTLVHFTGDFYASFIIPLLPVFVERFSLSMAQVGFLAGINRFLAFIVQPPAGYIADHYRTRVFVLGGPILAMLFIPLAGLASGFPALLLLIAVGSVGQSMFHPTSAGMISTFSGRHFGLSMSVFTMGGTLAFAVGPLFITYVVKTYGLEACPWTMLVGLPLVVLLFFLIPLPEAEGLGSFGFLGSIKEAMGPFWKMVLLIWVIMVLRAFVTQSFLTFVPVFYSKGGYSLVSVGVMISVFTVAGTLSGLLSGYFADRVGYKPVFLISHTLCTPLLFLMLFPRGDWIYPSAFLAGFFAMATLPLGLAWAQELAPKGRSMVSSLMMGLAFGTGGLMSPITGKLADVFSIQTVLEFVAFIPLLTLIPILLLPGRGLQTRSE